MTTIVYPDTLKTALADTNIPAGSRLLLRGGTYTEGDLRCYLSDVTITNYPGETVVLRPASGYRVLLFQDVQNIVLDGLEIDGTNVTNEGIKITNTSNNIRVTNCEIHHCNSQGLLLTQAIHHIEIDNCNIHHNGQDHLDHGIYVWSTYDDLHVTVHNNVIANNSSNGFHAYNSAGNGYYIVRNNYFDANGEVGIGCYYGRAEVYNNVVRDTQHRGIALRYYLENALLVFNTILNSGEQNIDITNLSKPTPTIQIYNTLFSGIGQGIVNNTAYPFNAGGNFTAWDNLSTNAITDNGGADVTANSGASGAGLVVTGLAVDYGGNARANPPTIGAWE